MTTRRGRAMVLLSSAALLWGVVVLAWADGPNDQTNNECDESLFPATGQTTCWNSAGTVIPCAGTGQDGDIQAGATLRYRDLGNGTIKDRVTKLIWEKKSDDGSIHDVGNTYSWANAFASHVAGLNAANFAGRNYWRVPNVKELPSIIDYETFNPGVDPAFNNGCTTGCTVLTCSCTAASAYWSSSTNADSPSDAWVVFFGGNVFDADKSDSTVVRAVRGGC